MVEPVDTLVDAGNAALWFCGFESRLLRKTNIWARLRFDVAGDAKGSMRAPNHVNPGTKTNDNSIVKFAEESLKGVTSRGKFLSVSA